MKETRAFCCLLYFTIVLKVVAYTTVQPSISSAGNIPWLFLDLFNRFIFSSLPDCANLSNKVYCFPRCFINASCYDDIYVFDISKNFGKPLSNLANIWEAIKPASNGISFGKRNDPQTIALPDGKSFFVQGGYDTKTSGSINKTIVYNAETNAWSARPNYYEGPNGGDRQMYVLSVFIAKKKKFTSFFLVFRQLAPMWAIWTVLFSMVVVNSKWERERERERVWL